jgi:hypothetical protein
MIPDHSHDRVFRFRFRQILILGLYSAVLLKIILPLIRYAGYTRTGPTVFALVLSSPPLLALLVAMIERPGPLKNWAMSLLLCLFFPALVFYHDVAAVHDYLAYGRRPTLWATLLINTVILTNSLPYVARMVPRPCPNCRRRTLVPLLGMFKRDKRTAKTCWCASCGAKFWKDREGEWRPERRKTWLDESAQPSTPGLPSSPAVANRVPTTTHRQPGQQVAQHDCSS